MMKEISILILVLFLVSCKGDKKPTATAPEVFEESVPEMSKEMKPNLEENVEVKTETETKETRSETKTSVTKESEPKVSEAKKEESKVTETKAAEPKVTKPKVTEPAADPGSEKKGYPEYRQTDKLNATIVPKDSDKINETNEANGDVEEAGKKPAIPPRVYEEKIEEVKTDKYTKSNVKPGTKVLDHTLFSQLLTTHISNTGHVNYAGIKKELPKLNEYLAILEAADLSKLSTAEQFAFYMNAYNAYTIKMVLDNYPTKSIKDLEGGKPWDKKWIKIGGKTLSLNNIENDIIRPTYNDARIHFGINCAAKSCPPLSNKVWQAGNLNTNLRDLTRAFIRNPKYNLITKDQIKVSKIFEWYAEDFGDLITFLNKYSEIKINPDAKIEYMDYDWNLNGK